MAQYKCYIFDFFYYVLFGFLIYHVISIWSYFGACHNPLNIWLIVTFGFYITKRFFLFLMNYIQNPNRFKHILSFYLIIIYPGFTYWTIQGTFWIVEESKNSSCQNNVSIFWLFYLCLVLSFLMIVIIIIYTIYEIIHYYRMLRIRRRIESILNNIDTLLASNVLNNPFLNEENFEIDYGLTQEEKDHLRKIKLNQNNLPEVQLQDCSICIENLKENEEIILLPGCHHSFHSLCILSWLERKPFCPNCKGNIRIQIESELKEEDI